MDREDRERLEVLNRRVFNLARQKPFFEAFSKEVRETIAGDQQTISDVIGGMLGEAIWHQACDDSFEDWKNKAEVRQLCLGGVIFDLEKFYRLVADNCKAEIDACYLIETLPACGTSVFEIEKEVERVIAEVEK